MTVTWWASFFGFVDSFWIFLISFRLFPTLCPPCASEVSWVTLAWILVKDSWKTATQTRCGSAAAKSHVRAMPKPCPQLVRSCVHRKVGDVWYESGIACIAWRYLKILEVCLEEESYVEYWHLHQIIQSNRFHLYFKPITPSVDAECSWSPYSWLDMAICLVYALYHAWQGQAGCTRLPRPRSHCPVQSARALHLQRPHKVCKVMANDSSIGPTVCLCVSS